MAWQLVRCHLNGTLVLAKANCQKVGQLARQPCTLVAKLDSLPHQVQARGILADHRRPTGPLSYSGGKAATSRRLGLGQMRRCKCKC